MSKAEAVEKMDRFGESVNQLVADHPELMEWEEGEWGGQEVELVRRGILEVRDAERGIYGMVTPRSSPAGE